MEVYAMTIMELGNKLNDMYENAPRNEQSAMIHLFAIIFANEIEASGATNAEIVKAAKMGISYQVEVAKGRKLAKYVSVNPETIKKYKG